MAVQHKLDRTTAGTRQATAAQAQMFLPLLAAQPCITVQAAAAVQYQAQVAQQATRQAATADHQARKVLTQQQLTTVAVVVAVRQRKAAQAQTVLFM